MLSERQGKDLSPKFTKLSLAEIVEDQLVTIWHVCTYCHKQNLSSKIQAFNTKIAWHAAFKEAEKWSFKSKIWKPKISSFVIKKP